MTEFSARELATVGLLLRAASRSEIMPQFRRLGPENVRTKSGPFDFVTDADEAAERMITAGLLHHFPGCRVIGEEATAADPTLLAGLGDAELAFVVDPIDGTANFAAGLPLFGCMAAAISYGRVVASAIHDPVCDDTAFARHGAGAWAESADGRRTELRVAAAVPLAEMAGAASWRTLPEPLRGRVVSRLGGLAGSWDYRCAAHQYWMTAAGHAHYLMFNRLMPWDHAPGWLLHQEAGGASARFDGSPYDPAETAGGLICAPDPTSVAALRAMLLDADKGLTVGEMAKN